MKKTCNSECILQLFDFLARDDYLMGICEMCVEDEPIEGNRSCHCSDYD
jgi:hypothetical protein